MKCLIVAVVVLVAITVAASEQQSSRNVTTAAVSSPAKITKREAILLNSMPMDSNQGYKKQAKIIYRRVSRTKRRPYRTNGYGKPHHLHQPHKYGPPKNTRRPPKKHQAKDLKTKYSPPKSRRNQKPKKYRPPSPHKYNRPMHFGAPHVPYTPQEPAGFGEPPADHFAVNNRNPSFGEPPTDSYGTPLHHSLMYGQAPYKSGSFGQNSYTAPADVHNSQSFPPNYASNQYNSYTKTQNQQHYSIEPHHTASSHLTHSVGSNYAPLNSDAYAGTNYDTVKGNSKIPSIDYNKNLNRDIYNYDDNQSTNYSPEPYQNHQSDYQSPSGKNKHVVEHAKNVNRPRNGPRGKKHAEEVLVGGQYAEPPARYVPKFQPSAPMHTDTVDSFVPPVKISLDSEELPSTYQSSYINYKHGNMAFSPQNLNDAFSIK